MGECCYIYVYILDYYLGFIDVVVVSNTLCSTAAFLHLICVFGGEGGCFMYLQNVFLHAEGKRTGGYNEGERDSWEFQRSPCRFLSSVVKFKFGLKIVCIIWLEYMYVVYTKYIYEWK